MLFKCVYSWLLYVAPGRFVERRHTNCIVLYCTAGLVREGSLVLWRQAYVRLRRRYGSTRRKKSANYGRPVMNVGGLTVVADALDVTLDENVARLFTRQQVDVVERDFVRVPDNTAQLVAEQTPTTTLSYTQPRSAVYWLTLMKSVNTFKWRKLKTPFSIYLQLH